MPYLCIRIDLPKAFDTVNNVKLLNTLGKIVIREIVLNFFK